MTNVPVPTMKSLADRVAALEQQTADNTSSIAKNAEALVRNTEALRAILTLLHPEPEHPEIDPSLPHAWLHDLVMHWIEVYGGRTQPPTGAIT